MKKLYLITFILFMLTILSGCGGKPPHHPKHPNYSIKKPKIKYTPNKKNLAKMVKQLQGSPYVWAEEGPNYFDCSGFTYYLYGSMGIEIPRTAREQARVGQRISANQLQYGDLIFFATSRHNKHRITHVGMYLGNGWFTHASTVKHEVIYSNLFKSKYYQNKLRVCRRYLPGSTPKTIAKQRPVWKQTPALAETKHPINKTMKKAIVIQAPRKTVEQTHPNGTYYVQVGSYIGRPESSKIEHITALHLHHKVIRFTQNGETISKLLVGPFKKREEALTILQKVRTFIAPDAFIAEIR